MAEVNFVLTDHGDHGIGISSPQFPGLIAGVPSMEDATATYLLALAREAAGDVDGFVVHVERVLQFDGRTFVIRCKQDYGTSRRAPIAQSLAEELTASPQFRQDWPQNSFGDVVLVAALASDRLGDLADAEQPGEPLIAVFPYGEDFKAVGIQAPSEPERGLTLDAYVAQLLRDQVRNGTGTPASVKEFALV